eukprot:4291999-Prymnesium_polylepis.1
MSHDAALGKSGHVDQGPTGISADQPTATGARRGVLALAPPQMSLAWKLKGLPWRSRHRASAASSCFHLRSCSRIARSAGSTYRS